MKLRGLVLRLGSNWAANQTQNSIQNRSGNSMLILTKVRVGSHRHPRIKFWSGVNLHRILMGRMLTARMCWSRSWTSTLPRWSIWDPTCGSIPSLSASTTPSINVYISLWATNSDTCQWLTSKMALLLDLLHGKTYFALWAYDFLLIN